MRILLINTFDQGGGAERVALDLLQAYLKRGHEAKLMVRQKRTNLDSVVEIDPYQGAASWAQLLSLAEKFMRKLPQFRGQLKIVDWLRRTALPVRWWTYFKGLEDIHYPASYNFAADPCWVPDVIHAHNLHGGYFDLRALPRLSEHTPIIWTLHDSWALTGHCGHFEDIDCYRWRSGCGNCPDLKRPPSIRRDSTAANWSLKRKIYRQSHLAIATPSRWLMNYVNQVMPPHWQKKVIPNGIDLTLYHPGNRSQARYELGLPQNAFICLFIGYGNNEKNPYKDKMTAVKAAHLMADLTDIDTIFLTIGSKDNFARHPWLYQPGYISDPAVVVKYYQAANVVLHAAHIENFPLVVLEAMACATPVIATAVGGIPEQLTDGEHGFLVPRNDVTAMAARCLQLQKNPDLANRMGEKAALHVANMFDLQRQVESYVTWFEELMRCKIDSR